MFPLAISIENISKKYSVTEKKNYDLVKIRSKHDPYTTTGVPVVEDMEFWALKNISFDVERGDVIGIIGKNGSGKSTILKIIAQITKPTTGVIKVRGSITAMLEIGAGFHPDLTGMENIFFYGNILGMKRSSIKDRLDNIIEFSGIRNFINTPVKHYSNGMYMRLAFSVLSHLDTDILLLDEVLSVGDAAFKLRCTQKIKDLAKAGKTQIIVSHSADEIMEYCSKCILLESGNLIAMGKPKEIFTSYMNKVQTAQFDLDDPKKIVVQTTGIGMKIFDSGGPENEVFKLLKISVRAAGKSIEEPILMSDCVEINYLIEKRKSSGYIQLILNIYDIFGHLLITDSSSFRKEDLMTEQISGKYSYTCVFPSRFFNSGIFNLSLVITENKKETNTWYNVHRFEVVKDEWIEAEPWSNLSTPLLTAIPWEVKKV